MILLTNSKAKMEWNYMAIIIFTTIGLSIPIVICCLVFLICDPKVPQTTKVLIHVFVETVLFIVSISYLQLSEK